MVFSLFRLHFLFVVFIGCMFAGEREERRLTWLSFFFERTKKTDFLLPTNELQNTTSSLGSGCVFRVVFSLFRVHSLFWCFHRVHACMGMRREETNLVFFRL